MPRRPEQPTYFIPDKKTPYGNVNNPSRKQFVLESKKPDSISEPSYGGGVTHAPETTQYTRPNIQLPSLGEVLSSYNHFDQQDQQNHPVATSAQEMDSKHKKLNTNMQSRTPETTQYTPNPFGIQQYTQPNIQLPSLREVFSSNNPFGQENQQSHPVTTSERRMPVETKPIYQIAPKRRKAKYRKPKTKNIQFLTPKMPQYTQDTSDRHATEFSSSTHQQDTQPNLPLPPIKEVFSPSNPQDQQNHPVTTSEQRRMLVKTVSLHHRKDEEREHIYSEIKKLQDAHDKHINNPIYSKEKRELMITLKIEEKQYNGVVNKLNKKKKHESIVQSPATTESSSIHQQETPRSNLRLPSLNEISSSDNPFDQQDQQNHPVITSAQEMDSKHKKLNTNMQSHTPETTQYTPDPFVGIQQNTRPNIQPPSLREVFSSDNPENQQSHPVTTSERRIPVRQKKTVPTVPIYQRSKEEIERIYSEIKKLHKDHNNKYHTPAYKKERKELLEERLNITPNQFKDIISKINQT
jgi:hypothetical protein